MNNNPIGILDSGLGGLTVWNEIVSQLPHESTIYIADSLNIPYGTKSQNEIYMLAKKLVEFMLTKNVKLIVIGCNTITVSCLDKLRNDYPNLPIIGTVPIVKTAAEVTKNKKIGVISTTTTAESQYQKDLINKFTKGIGVLNLGTDTLVPLIENGELESKEIQKSLQEALIKFKKEKIDTLALGCTHFPFLRDKMQEFLGPEVIILDSGQAIARQVKRVLANNHALSEEKSPDYEFYTTGNPKIAKKLLASTIKGKEMPEFSVVNL